MNRYQQRIHSLQSRMQEQGIDYVIIPTGDYHNSEYVCSFFEIREFYSGFTGSNGTLVVTADQALLWTDGRYFIQAEKELSGSDIILCRMMEENVPTIAEYIAQNIREGQKIGFDGRILSIAFILDSLCQEVQTKRGFTPELVYDFDPAEGIWIDRPKMPARPVFLLPHELTGRTVKEKLAEVCDRLEQSEKQSEGLFLSKLDDIMWLYNMRGNDIECNPVAMSYAYVSREESILFLQESVITDEIKTYAATEGFRLLPYQEADTFCTSLKGHRILLDEIYTSYSFYVRMCQKNEVIFGTNPTTEMKAVKNETELAALRKAYHADSVAVTKFIYWIKQQAGNMMQGLDEYTAGAYLDNLRAQIPGYIELSFPTICAYGANAAMMHYEATETDHADLRQEGFLLVDSGGQYMGGTTDVTRTISLGALTHEMKEHFTYVLKGMLALQNACFLYGCTGRNLDILAREPLWKHGIDYKCGTGHGVGFILNVHEGPQGIRWKYNPKQLETTMEEGMLVTDEPGVYMEGSHGIRTENVLLCQKKEKTGDGQFMHFEVLTLAPIDRDAILPELLSKEEMEELNEYHRRVFKDISPYLSADERKWLEMETKNLTFE